MRACKGTRKQAGWMDGAACTMQGTAHMTWRWRAWDLLQAARLVQGSRGLALVPAAGREAGRHRLQAMWLCGRMVRSSRLHLQAQRVHRALWAEDFPSQQQLNAD